MHNRSGDFSEGIYQLAEQCEIGIGAACRRAGISPATPPRWKTGTRPRPVQLRKLRRVIVEMAREAGTLPAGVSEEQGTVLPVPSTDIDVREGLRTIVRTAQAIEAKLDSVA